VTVKVTVVPVEGYAGLYAKLAERGEDSPPLTGT
jgi:hypothetical protein